MPMAADSFAPGWLLFLVQLPSKPSSARVALWRRLRAIGATTMVNGAWVLPDTAAHAALFGRLRERVLRQGGTAFVLSIPGSPPEMAAAIVQAFPDRPGQGVRRVRRALYRFSRRDRQGGRRREVHVRRNGRGRADLENWPAG